MLSLSVEDFSSWFRSQEAATRLDIMTAALQMLHPLELRFIASCVEDLTRKDYYCFRECELRYNGGNFADDFADLTDVRCRSKLLVALSLLYSGNHTTACVLFKTLLSLYAVFEKLPKTKEVIDEVLLLLNMAKHHPAFKFEQRAAVAELTEEILHHWKQRMNCSSANRSETPSPSSGNFQDPTACNKSQDNASDGRFSIATGGRSNNEIGSAKVLVDSGSQTEDDLVPLQPKPISPTCITEEIAVNQTAKTDQSSLTCFAECIGSLPPDAAHTICHVEDAAVTGLRKTGSRNCFYEFRVRWSNGEETTVEKSFKDWHSLHKDLLTYRPNDAGALASDRKLPYFPGFLSGLHDESEEALLEQMNTYLKELRVLPEIFHSAYFANFLTTSSVPFSSTLIANGWSAEAELTDANECTRTSDNGIADINEMNNRAEDENPNRSHTLVSDTRDEKDEATGSETNGPPLEEQCEPSMSATPQRELQKSPLVLSYSRPVEQSFLPSATVRGNYDGFHQSIATTLLIVRPNSTSPSLDKILQSNLLPRDSPPKLLASNTGIGKVEPASMSAAGACVSNDRMQ